MVLINISKLKERVEKMHAIIHIHIHIMQSIKTKDHPN